MAITFAEKPDSRQWATGDNAYVDFLYSLAGTSSDTTAKTYVEANTDSLYEGLVRQSVELNSVWVDTDTDTGLWNVVVRYGVYEGSAFEFDTTGGTQHITQSLGTIWAIGAGGTTPPSTKGAIGATDKTVEGVDIPVPVYRFSETQEIAASYVTDAYKGIIFFLTARTNNASFKGFWRGEVLFLGAVGSQKSNANWDISFHFAASPNVTNLWIGPDITVPAKWGWEYLWVRYKEVLDSASGVLTQVPMAAYVERVYQEGDMSGLAIGV